MDGSGIPLKNRVYTMHRVTTTVYGNAAEYPMVAASRQDMPMIAFTTGPLPSLAASSPPAMLASMPPIPAMAMTVVGAVKSRVTVCRLMLKVRKTTSQERAANISHMWHI